MKADTVSLLLIIISMLLSAFFSATETAFSSLNRLTVKAMSEKGNKRAKTVLELSEKYDNVLSTILIGNNVVNILAASLATVLFVRSLGEDVGTTVSTVVMTVLVLVFCEVSPKSIVKESPERFAIAVAPVVKFLVVLFTPLNFLFMLWKKLLSRIFKSKEDTSMTEEEILYMVEEAEQEGEIDTQEGELIRSAIDFNEQEVIDVLTPRIDITAVSKDVTEEELVKLFSETGYSRLPVFDGTVDHIIGIIHHKDFYNKVYGRNKPISDIVKPAIFVPRTKKIGALLKELQQQKSQLAVVLDEFGGTVGIITLEDIIEELVGEIWDEHDEVSQEISIKSEDEADVLGSTALDDFFEHLDIEPDEDELSGVTVNGWITSIFDRVPSVGEKFSYRGFEILITAMDENRVDKVRVTKLPEEDSEEKEDEDK